MEEKASILLLVALSLAGLCIVYYAVSTIEPERVEIGDVEESMIGRLVVVEGSVDSVKFSNSGNIYLTVNDDTGKITVPLLGNLAKRFDPTNLKKGFSVQVTGIVSEYNYDLEIMPKNENGIIVFDGFENPVGGDDD